MSTPSTQTGMSSRSEKGQTIFNNSIAQHVCERFYVTPKTGQHFDGVLTQSDKAYYVFADVKARPVDDDPQPVVGELWIEKSNVAYLQRLPHHADD